MIEINSIGFALDPSNVPSFLLDWEITKLCNLDCSYCSTGIDGGHDNTTKHPSLDECLETIDFMYEYVDLYMRFKKNSQKKVVLNLYGGESLFHPDIVTILQQCKQRYEQYKDKWLLTIICTTNGVVGSNQWKKIVPLIDEFTLSYHTEALPKQKQQYKDNVLYLKNQNKKFKCSILMHSKKELFEDAENFINFCKDNEVRYFIKPLDNYEEKWNYSTEQFKTLKTFWINSTAESKKNEYSQLLDQVGEDKSVSFISEGRMCCGGRKLSINNNLKSSVTFVPKQGFKDWYCSVNWFFLFVRQVDKNVFTNKDCKMSTSGNIEPLGNLNDSKNIINTLKYQLETKTMPIIQCKKELCICGFCAPKAESKLNFMELIKRNVTDDVFLKETNYGN